MLLLFCCFWVVVFLLFFLFVFLCVFFLGGGAFLFCLLVVVCFDVFGCGFLGGFHPPHLERALYQVLGSPRIGDELHFMSERHTQASSS